MLSPALGGMSHVNRRRKEEHMNWNNIQDGWNEYEGDAKLQWSKLSPEQIKATQGQRDHLSARLQEVYAVSPEEAERQIADWQGKQIEKSAPAAKS
jgi:uncharacterized protein YjbJ (UPF0337 family)